MQRVLENAPSYAQAVTGGPPGPAEAQSLFSALPPDVGYEDKFVWSIVRDGTTIGCADVIRGWPTSDTALIGLLLIDETHQGQGAGRLGYEAIEARVRQWPQIKVMRAAVVATNAGVLPFWHRMGFRQTGEVKPYRYDKVVSEVMILTKRL